MDTPSRVSSQRERHLLESAYEYVLKHGLTNFSLRPLALAIGSSPRVFVIPVRIQGGLVKALLTRARDTELSFLGEMNRTGAGHNFPEVVRRVAVAVRRATPTHVGAVARDVRALDRRA